MMFSKEYFRYLLSSNRYLLILLLLVGMLNALGNTIRGLDLILQGVFAVGCSFILPMIVFYHVHDKKAVDSYLSLPVSRKAMLVTGIVFCFLGVYLMIAIGCIAFGIKGQYPVDVIGSSLPSPSQPFNVLLALAVMVPTCLALVMFNTALYLIGNDLIDGVIMMGAYTCLPLAIYIVINSFFYSFVAGGNNPDLSVIRFFSPIYMSAELLLMIAEQGKVYWSSLIGLCIAALLSAYLLHRSYVLRKAERANSRSTSFFSYPLVINLYLIVCVFAIATLYGMRYKGLGEFLGDHFVLYILLFAAFVAAYFLYRRKFYFSFRLPAFYLIVVLISLLFVSSARSSRGFGLSDRYEKAKGPDIANIDIWFADADNEMNDYIYEQQGKRSGYVGVFVQVNGDKTANQVSLMSEETSDIIERYRKKAIDDFYEGEYAEYETSSHITIVPDGGFSYSQYTCNEAIALKDLIALAKDPSVRITVTTEEGEYRIGTDGTLRIYHSYVPDVTKP